MHTQVIIVPHMANDLVHNGRVYHSITYVSDDGVCVCDFPFVQNLEIGEILYPERQKVEQTMIKDCVYLYDLKDLVAFYRNGIISV